MSAGILNALMQLFAILAGGKDESEGSGRDIVSVFLSQQLNSELVNEYLKIFDEFVAQIHKKSGKKRTSVNSVKVLRICSAINEELAQREKFFVLMRLIEFVCKGTNAGDQEWEFVETVAESFHIPSTAYANSRRLIELEEDEIEDHEDFTYITSTPMDGLTQAGFTFTEGLAGRLVFYRIQEENIFFARAFGSDTLILNGQALHTDQSYIFKQGSSIRGPKIKPIYYSDVIKRYIQDTDAPNIQFYAEEIQYFFPNGHRGLHNLNVFEGSGNLVGIMGGSGSGKSTLLNVLNGNYVPSVGTVKINGVDVHHDAKEIEGVIGYVAQDDLLIDELTVFDNLYYNAKLCFKNLSEEEIVKAVEHTLSSLGLYEAKDLRVGSPLDKTISGGQRKRLNIALELIREPSVLFVDEPTSGLSSRDSENIMDLLKELTLKGQLVFVVIHQPSSDIFKMFDKLFLLDKGGFPIYYGNPVDSIIYFKNLVNHANQDESECPVCGNVNPEQIFNIIEAKVVDEYGQLTEHRKITPKEWGDFYNVKIGDHLKKSDDEVPVPESSLSIPSKIAQFKTFLIRDVKSKISNKQYMLINFLEAPLLAVLLSFFIKYYKTEGGESSYIFFENENLPQFLFISVIVALFLGLTVSAEEIIRDKKILKREQFLNLSKGSYLFSKISIMFVISAIQMATFVAVGNSILVIKGMYLPYWIILFSTSCFANVLGLNISATFNSAKVIYIIIPVLIIPQLLFSGIIVKFDKLYPIFSSQSEVPWIGNIMASRWAFEALSVYQFKNNDYERNFYAYDQYMKYSNWKKDFWLKDLQRKAEKVKHSLESGNEDEKFDYNLKVLHNEIQKEVKEMQSVNYDQADMLTPEKVTVSAIEDLQAYFSEINTTYKKIYNTLSMEKESRIEILQEAGKTQYLLLKDSYSNESLSDFVTNKNDVVSIVEENHELVQKVDLIYKVPMHKGFFEAHFYAPSKNLFGNQLNTFFANLLVIWGMSVLFAMILFVDGFRWVIEDMPERIKLLFQKK